MADHDIRVFNGKTTDERGRTELALMYLQALADEGAKYTWEKRGNLKYHRVEILVDEESMKIKM